MSIKSKFSQMSKSKRVILIIVMAIIAWNLVFLPLYFVFNNISANAEERGIFNQAIEFIQGEESFKEVYGEILKIEKDEVIKETKTIIAVLVIETEKERLNVKVYFEPKTPSDVAVYPSRWETFE